MAAKVGPSAPPRKSGSPWRSRSPSPWSPRICLLGGQAVVIPVSWALPSTHAVWLCPTAPQLPPYSGATVNGSAVGSGTLAGLLMFARPPGMQLNSGLRILTSLASTVLLVPSVKLAIFRQVLGENTPRLTG